MIANQVANQIDFITPHITDGHTLDYPCLKSGFVCDYELPRWNPIHLGGFTLDVSPTRHVVMLLVAQTSEARTAQDPLAQIWSP